MKHHKKNHTWTILLIVMLITLSINSCKKYEDGPWISLRRKKVRLLGEWVVVSINGEDQSSKGELILDFQETPFKPIVITFSSNDGNSNDSYAISGNWTWKSNKEIVEVRADILKADWTILRLKKNEFWFLDEHNKKWKCEKY